MVPFLQIWQYANRLQKLLNLTAILTIFMANLAHADADKVQTIIFEKERESNVKLVSNFLGAGPVLITGPQGRPSFEEVLPISTSTFAELLASETDIDETLFEFD